MSGDRYLALNLRVYEVISSLSQPLVFGFYVVTPAALINGCVATGTPPSCYFSFTLPTFSLLPKEGRLLKLLQLWSKWCYHIKLVHITAHGSWSSLPLCTCA